MLNRKQIADKIETKLGYTNGWKIEDEKYSKLCLELADEIVGQIEPLVRQGASSAGVACGHWRDAQIFKPEPKTDVLFLAEFGGELQECYGFYVDENLWIDKTTQDRDGDYYEVYSTRYWLKLDSKPSA